MQRGITISKKLNRSVCQKCNQKIHYRDHNSPLEDHVLSQISSVQVVKTYLFKVDFNIILSHKSWTDKYLPTGAIRIKIKLAQRILVLTLKIPNFIEMSSLVLKMKHEYEHTPPHKTFMCTNAVNENVTSTAVKS